jgi:hypothetical protein
MFVSVQRLSTLNHYPVLKRPRERRERFHHARWRLLEDANFYLVLIPERLPIEETARTLRTLTLLDTASTRARPALSTIRGPRHCHGPEPGLLSSSAGSSVSVQTLMILTGPPHTRSATYMSRGRVVW